MNAVIRLNGTNRCLDPAKSLSPTGITGEADSRTFLFEGSSVRKTSFSAHLRECRKDRNTVDWRFNRAPIVLRSFSIAKAVSHSDIDVYANHCGTTLWRITGKISLKATPLPVYRYANISLDRYQLFPLR